MVIIIVVILKQMHQSVLLRRLLSLLNQIISYQYLSLVIQFVPF